MTVSTWAMEQAAAVLQRALADEPDEDGVLVDPIEAEADLRDRLHSVLRGVLEANKLAEAAGSMIDDLRERQARFKARADRLRGAAYACMEVLGSSRLEYADVTASTRSAPAKTIVTDESVIPDQFVRLKREIDRAALTAALKAGETVEGAELSQQIQTLQIRSK